MRLRPPTLPPFDPSATCPKCAHDDVSTTFETSGHCYGTSYPRSWCKAAEGYGKPYCCEIEHLHRTCQRCRFAWSEWPIDVEVHDA